MARRVVFLVDGFNLYHSLEQAERDLGIGTKWLDLPGLCETYLYGIGGGAKLEKVFYFSAPADHVEQTKPGAVDRHRTYIRALRSRDVVVELGTFKEKRRHCPKCSQEITSHEEKETDVAIAVRLLQQFWSDSCDVAVIVSADSDLSPAIREAKRSFPAKPIFCCFPYGRGTLELRSLTKVFKIKAARYLKHQFPSPIILRDGTKIEKPASW